MGDTADRLAAAALELIGERGYDDVTTTDIAEAAGVSQRTFFRHFATKSDVIFHGTDLSTAAFLELLYGQPSEMGVFEALATAIEQHDRAWPLSPGDVERVRLARDHSELGEAVAAYEIRFETSLARWLGQRLRRPADDFDIRVLAAALVAARRIVVDEWSHTDGVADLGPLARQAIALVSGQRDPHDTAVSP